MNGASIDAAELPLPSRIITLTTSPFDKFPLTRTSSKTSTASSISPRYAYLGLRDSTGKAAFENLLFRSVELLIEDRDDDYPKRRNISQIFDFLELAPHLTVVYKTHISNSVMAAVRKGAPVVRDGVIRDSRTLRRDSGCDAQQ